MLLAAAASGLVTYVLYRIARFLNDFPGPARFILQIADDSMGAENLVIILALLLFAVAFYLMTGGTIRRIGKIIEAVRRIEGGSLETRIEAGSDDELGDLSAAINGMAGRMEALLAEERQAEQAKRDLITSVSHDLRTPLTSIVGFLDLMRERKGKSEAELERYASIAHGKALRLQTLINELFDYTRVGFAGARLNLETISLNELAGQIAEEFYPAFHAAGLQCRLSLPDERVVVRADGELLHRLLDNLIQNALQYGGEGGAVDIALVRAPAGAIVTVTNYGPPIPAEHLPRIFDRFYRAERSRSRATGGTGLGLAIAAGIAGLHGGTINASSGADGTHFRVFLPYQAREGKR